MSPTGRIVGYGSSGSCYLATVSCYTAPAASPTYLDLSKTYMSMSMLTDSARVPIPSLAFVPLAIGSAEASSGWGGGLMALHVHSSKAVASQVDDTRIM